MVNHNRIDKTTIQIILQPMNKLTLCQHDYRNYFISGLAGLMALSSSCANKNNDNIKPNFIIIFADDMGYGDLACYGHPSIKTPNLDKMAEEGIRLTSFYAAASVSTPSRAGLLTGRYPIRNAPNNFGPESKDGLPLTEITIADILDNEGYKTMAIGKWHLGHMPEYLPISRGFDAFYGLPYSNDMILPWCPWLTENHKLELYIDSVPIREIGFEQDNLTVDYTEKAIEFIRSSSTKPFFLYLAHSMPHLPVSTSGAFRGKSNAGLYGDVIQTIDWSTGEILNTLKDLGIDRNTMVIFASDNGPWHNLPERMLQRGVEPYHTGSTGPLRGAKGTTYEGGFRVPGIIRWPEQIPANQVSDGLATTIDLFATIVQIAGGTLPDDRTIDGNNILKFLKEEEETPTHRFFYHAGNRLEAVRIDNWKLRNTKSAGIELFDLQLDPAEKYNLAEKNPEIKERLLKEMLDFANETNAGTETDEN
jgi:arylsulfatase A